MKINKNITKTIMFCLFISYSIYSIKPDIVFDDKNDFKKFGLSKEETIYPFWLIITVASFIFYSGCLINNGNYI